MKRFRFPLESVKTMRGLHEQRAREAFSAELRLLERAEAHLRSVREQRRALTDSIVSARAATFYSGELTAGLAALQVAGQAEADAAKARAAANTRLEQARERWLECRRQLETILRLEHRARLEHREACEKDEQSVLDDLASMHLARAAAFL